MVVGCTLAEHTVTWTDRAITVQLDFNLDFLCTNMSCKRYTFSLNKPSSFLSLSLPTALALFHSSFKTTNQPKYILSSVPGWGAVRDIKMNKALFLLWEEELLV
jgi:hypothetical protein